VADGSGSGGGGRLEVSGASATWTARLDDQATSGISPGQPGDGGGSVG
jgi:hypothetical protein